MSDGYNVVFDPYNGTLYGRFPAGPVFVSVFLALADKNGCVDASLKALAGKTGWPMDFLMRAISELMEPDPESRSRDFDGRRLVLIDPARPWGWRIVNHRVYREKARLMAKSVRETESGANAGRMTNRRRPPVTAGDPLSNTNTNTNTDKPPLPPASGGSGVFDSNLDSDADSTDQFPDPVDAAPHVRYAVALRNRGVFCDSNHVTLIQWEREGFTLEQVLGAVMQARQSKPFPERLNPGYVNAVLRNAIDTAARGPPQKLTRFEQAERQLTEASGGNHVDTS
jgi:hypothetical protein